MLGSSWGHLEWCFIQLLSCRKFHWSAHMVLFLFGEVLGRHAWCIPFVLAELKIWYPHNCIGVWRELLEGMTNSIWIDFGSLIWIWCDHMTSIVTLLLGFVIIVWWVNIRVWSAWRRSCVDLRVYIVCRSRGGDRVSIVERCWVHWYSA